MNVAFATNVKKFRADRGFTQGDLAVLLSVSPQAVSRWENSQAYPDIETLPLLAQCLGVSIDDLMGTGKLNKQKTKEELGRRLAFRTDDSAAELENELCILDIYEELGRGELVYLTEYFRRLMSHEKWEKLNYRMPEERIAQARQILRDRMHTTNLADRMKLLYTVALWEDEDKLWIWEDEYRLPENMQCFTWDGMHHARYARTGDAEKRKKQNQKELKEFRVWKCISEMMKKEIIYFCLLKILKDIVKFQEQSVFLIKPLKWLAVILFLCLEKNDYLNFSEMEM